MSAGALSTVYRTPVVLLNQLLRPTTGFTDGANCSGGGLTVINFSGLVSFTSHAGVSFLNATTADTATVSSATFTPDNQIEYTLTWGVAAPLANEEVRYLYDSGLGNYIDSDLVAMADQNIRITNCLDSALPLAAITDPFDGQGITDPFDGQFITDPAL